jgi:hypothetical protein
MISGDSKYYRRYYNHVMDKKKTKGTLGKVFDLIHDLDDRRGIKNEWRSIDGEIQDEIIEKWKNIIDKK